MYGTSLSFYKYRMYFHMFQMLSKSLHFMHVIQTFSVTPDTYMYIYYNASYKYIHVEN